MEGVVLVFADFQFQGPPVLTSFRGDWVAGREIAARGNASADTSGPIRRWPPWSISRTASAILSANSAWEQVFLVRPLYTIASGENGRPTNGNP